mgnify:CR=1 FL=1
MSKKIFKKVGLFVTTTAISIMLPTTALANRFLDQIRGQLMLAAISANINQYKLTHEPFLDSLDRGNADYLNINLLSGNSYTILGVCDEDCGDMDLKLYDENGNLIDSDTIYDDTPVVNVTPNWSGRFQVKVTMPSCTNSPCYYGVGVWGR